MEKSGAVVAQSHTCITTIWLLGFPFSVFNCDKSSLTMALDNTRKSYQIFLSPFHSLNILIWWPLLLQLVVTTTIRCLETIHSPTSSNAERNDAYHVIFSSYLFSSHVTHVWPFYADDGIYKETPKLRCSRKTFGPCTKRVPWSRAPFRSFFIGEYHPLPMVRAYRPGKIWSAWRHLWFDDQCFFLFFLI